MKPLARIPLALLLVAFPSLIDLLGAKITPGGWGIFMSTFNAVWVSIGVYTVLYFEMSLLRSNAEIQSGIDALNKKIEGSKCVVRKLPDAEFYTEFLSAAKKATSYVWICYFKSDPPNVDQDAALKAYYDSMYATIKTNRLVKFRRVILDTEKNRAWVTEMAQALELNNCTNAEIYLLKQGSKIANQYYALSTQIIDDSKVWVVAVGEHQSSDGFRDLFIESADAAVMMKKYFERLVDMSEDAFKDGKNLLGDKPIRRKSTAAITKSAE